MHYTSKEVYKFISKQTNLPTGQAGDPIVEWKICRISGQQFPIYQSDLDFYAKISPTFDGKKFPIPTPTLCPEERQRRRLAFRNERKLYKRKCDATGENIISIYSPEKPYKVYKQDFRRSDKRDPMDYGREFDFSKTFTQNFGELLGNVPLLGLMNMENENSEYTNYTGRSKNCYLCNDVMYAENLFYANIIINCSNSLEVTDGKNCTESYEILRSENSRMCSYSNFLKDCNNCHYSEFLQNCKNCIFCVGLINKEYYVLNKRVSEDEFVVLMNKLHFGTLQALYGQYKVIRNGFAKSATINNGSQRVSGNLMSNSKDCVLYFDSYDNEGCKYGFNGDANLNCFDVSVCNPNCSFSYEMISGGEGYNSAFTIACGFLQSGYYSFLCFNSSHLFGCIGLRNKQYCIFNKQYTKDDYETTVAKIIAHMQETGERGEFFHPSLSPFGYNETVAQEYFPVSPHPVSFIPDRQALPSKGTEVLQREGAEGGGGVLGRESLKNHGYTRQTNNYDPVIPAGAQVLKGDQIPSDITTVSDDILKSIFVCEVSGRPFRIIKQELDFYRKHHLPLPRKHPDVRHEERMKLRPGRTMFLRTCDKCGKEMLSVYQKVQKIQKNQKEKNHLSVCENSESFEPLVYCEECYVKEVYG